MPPAARITDMHTCPKVEPGPKPHVGGPVTSGEPTVIIGHQPAARVGDQLVCIGPLDAVSEGEPTVLIGNKPAARVTDQTLHSSCVAPIPGPSGMIRPPGCPTVLLA